MGMTSPPRDGLKIVQPTCGCLTFATPGSPINEAQAPLDIMWQPYTLISPLVEAEIPLVELDND